MPRKLYSLLPLGLIALAILIIYLTGAYHFISFEALQQEHLKLRALVDAHPFLAALYFIGIYTASVILILPDSTFLSVLAGFLFPFPLALSYVLLSETLGSTLFYKATKLACLEPLGRKKETLLYSIHQKFQKDQICYLLFFRLSHLLPYWIINLGAGIFHVRTFPFIWTTLVGVFPLSFLLVEGGENLSAYLTTHTHFNLRELFTPQLKLTLLGLGCVALLPIIYRKIKKRN